MINSNIPSNNNYVVVSGCLTVSIEVLTSSDESSQLLVCPCTGMKRGKLGWKAGTLLVAFGAKENLSG